MWRWRAYALAVCKLQVRESLGVCHPRHASVKCCYRSVWYAEQASRQILAAIRRCITWKARSLTATQGIPLDRACRQRSLTAAKGFLSIELVTTFDILTGVKHELHRRILYRPEVMLFKLLVSIDFLEVAKVFDMHATSLYEQFYTLSCIFQSTAFGHTDASSTCRPINLSFNPANNNYIYGSAYSSHTGHTAVCPVCTALRTALPHFAAGATQSLHESPRYKSLRAQFVFQLSDLHRRQRVLELHQLGWSSTILLLPTGR